MRAYPPGGPEVVCTLCGWEADYADMLDHFRYMHRGERCSTGVLVRPIRTINTKGEL